MIKFFRNLFNPFISPDISVGILTKMSQYSIVIVEYLFLSKKVNADFRLYLKR